MAGKLKAALDSRQDETVMIMARTDAIATDGFQAALDRMSLYREIGADILFVEAPTDLDQLRRIPAELDGPCVVNLIDGGATPVLSASEFQDMGYAGCVMPVTATHVIVKALKAYYGDLLENGDLRDAMASRRRLSGLHRARRPFAAAGGGAGLSRRRASIDRHGGRAVTRKPFEDSRNTPLADLRVLDLTRLAAGNMLTHMMADFGADVIKVERPGAGDDLRRFGTNEAWWKVYSRSKRSLALNLGSGEGRDILLKLAETADVLVENFVPGTLERMGIGPEVLMARNPSLVIARVSGWGQTGPYGAEAGLWQPDRSDVRLCPR